MLISITWLRKLIGFRFNAWWLVSYGFGVVYLMFHPFIFVKYVYVLSLIKSTLKSPIFYCIYVNIYSLYLLIIILCDNSFRYSLDLRCERSLLILHYNAFRVLIETRFWAYQFWRRRRGLKICLQYFCEYILVNNCDT
jgi:hypothetical protein